MGVWAMEGDESVVWSTARGLFGPTDWGAPVAEDFESGEIDREWYGVVGIEGTGGEIISEGPTLGRGWGMKF